MTNEQGEVAGGKLSVMNPRPRKTHVRPRSVREEVKRASVYSITTTSAMRNMTSDDASSNPSSSGEVFQTAAEKAREKKLRDDPLAEVLGPLFVICKRCGSRIKLSPKSTYDPFHWQKHRERCLKKPAHVVNQKKQEAEALLYMPTKRSHPSGRAGLGSLTPPLTTDDDDEVGGHDRVKEESPSPGLEETTSPPNNVGALRQPDRAFEDYLYRSRRKMTRDLSPLCHENWTAWNWSQLRSPVWAMAPYPEGADDEPMNMDTIAQSRDSVTNIPRHR